MRKIKWRSLILKLVLATFITLIGGLVFFWDLLIYGLFEKVPNEQLICYEMSQSQIPEIEENQVILGKSIFFHETSCHKEMSDIKLDARQSCSIESALRAHPNTDVYLLISSPVFRPLEKTENVLVQQLLTYPNFKLRHITFSKYLSNTPIHNIYTSGILNFSSHPVEHASDVLRYTTLYKFGGIYLDLDTIVLKPINKLKNFAGMEAHTFIGSSILGFDYDKIGREVAIDCAEEVSRNYEPKIWAHNGPGVITRVLEKRCKSNITEQLHSNCGGFHIHPSTSFYAINYENAEMFFSEGLTDKVLQIVNQSYTIHLWNKLSFNCLLENSKNIPFLKFAKEYCPKIYNGAKGDFNL